MLISQIVTETINETGGDSTDSTLQALMFGFTLAALRRIPQFTRDRLLLAVGQVTLANMTYQAQVPTDFIKEREIWHFSLDGNTKKEIHKGSFRDVQRSSRLNQSHTFPTLYHIFNTTIEFNFMVSPALIIYIDYFKDISNVQLTDTFAGNSRWVELVKDLLKMYYYEYQENSELYAAAQARSKSGIAELDANYMEEEFGDSIEES